MINAVGRTLAKKFDASPKGKVDKKKQKKLTNVSLVCMYVGRKSEMSIFSVFFPQQK